MGLHVNMILYLLQEYNFDPATGAIVVFLWNAVSNCIPMFGAFLSDSGLGRFRVIALGTIIDLAVSTTILNNEDFLKNSQNIKKLF